VAGHANSFQKKDPFAYRNVQWPKILILDFNHSSVRRPTGDQVGVLICAIIVHKMICPHKDLRGTVGTPPIPYENDR
jgi:hypothetical protein